MTERESVTIVLEIPNPVLSPNRPAGSIGGRMQKASAARRLRRLACEAATAAGVESGPWAKATVAAVFFHYHKRRRDDVNHLAMLKPVYDGLVDAGLLADDDAEHLTTLPARFEIDHDFPRVELTIERAETGVSR